MNEIMVLPPAGCGPPSNMCMFSWTPQVYTTNQLTIRSSVFVQYTLRRTHWHRLRATSV